MTYRTEGSTPRARAGKQYRSGEPRIFHVRDIGWFVRTRGTISRHEGLESQDGLAGPFPAELNARLYVEKYLKGE